MRSYMLLVALSLCVASCARDEVSKTAAQSEAVPTAAKVAAVPAKKAAAAKVTTVPAKKATADEGSSCAGMAEGKECSGGCDQWDGAANDVLRRELPENATWTTLAVEGMTCGGCERRIIANVGKTEGVLKVEADAELGRVRVATLDDQKALGAAKQTIKQLGYKVVD